MARLGKLLPMYAAVAAIGAVSSQPAGATIIQQWLGFDVDESLVSGQTLTFDLFDNSFGTLTDVVFTLDSDWDVRLDIAYDGAEGGSDPA